jgi:hypothetical protein
VEADLETTLGRLREYRGADPGFESAIAEFVQAEAELAGEDPAEGGAAPAVGPSQKTVRKILRG